jgi:hypothetical protein
VKTWLSGHGVMANSSTFGLDTSVSLNKNQHGGACGRLRPICRKPPSTPPATGGGGRRSISSKRGIGNPGRRSFRARGVAPQPVLETKRVDHIPHICSISFVNLDAVNPIGPLVDLQDLRGGLEFANQGRLAGVRNTMTVDWNELHPNHPGLGSALLGMVAKWPPENTKHVGAGSPHRAARPIVGLHRGSVGTRTPHFTLETNRPPPLPRRCWFIAAPAPCAAPGRNPSRGCSSDCRGEPGFHLDSAF